MQDWDHDHVSPATGFPFDADLTDLILITLRDLQSLESFALSSKFVYNVFNARRATILYAVVSNHLGPATSPAMRLLKVQMDVHSYWRGWLSPFPVAKLPREDDFDRHSSITMREAHKLATNHEVVQQIEGLYSWRNKDPRYLSSCLTSCESERFQTALYRVWFACALYGRAAPANRVKRSKLKRFSEILGDLGRMQGVVLFAGPSNLGRSGRVFSGESSLEAYLVWSGPDTILQAFQGKMAILDRKVVPILSGSYEQFCDVFNVASSPKQPRTRIINFQNEYFIVKLRCHRCSVRIRPGGLWSEANWSYLRGIAPPSEIFEFLDLPWWTSYTSADVLKQIFRSTPYSQILCKLFVCRSKTYETWKPGDWLCTTCLQKFMRDNIEAFCRSIEGLT